METIFTWLIVMAGAVLKNEKINTAGEEKINWDMLWAWAHFHNISNLVAYAIPYFTTVPQNVREKFQKEQLLTAFKETKQEAKVQALLKDFEQAGIACMPLKGFLLKHLYPKTDMRDMCDVDILIRTGEYEKIKPVMEKNGFVFDKESAHEYIYICKPAVTVELHKSLVPSYNHDLYAYYGDGWKFARRKEGYKYLYELPPEDFYIYTIVHAAKHYLNGGTGIRQAADIWVLNRHLCQNGMDQEYVDAELKKLGLVTFWNTFCRLCGVWFDHEASDPTVRQMERYILQSGVWGTKEQADRARLYRDTQGEHYGGARRRAVLRMVFPTMKGLKSLYPVLNKAPALYPVMMVRRWASLLLFRRERIKKSYQAGTLPDAELKQFARHCETVGLRRTL